MSKREWKLFVEDILESIELIEKYVENMQFDNFKNDRKTIDAVVRNFEIIGEASKFIPDLIKKKHQDVDWQGVVGLRNRIAHEYFTISPMIIWHIIEEELPKLKEEMQRILEKD
ncbi:MAG TPA: DUF86 domain-containing protein [Thermodesulfobacteriota bacterium]|nr:DUF86 domain-containing protein [Thermodesulfobacteriota bacterium]